MKLFFFTLALFFTHLAFGAADDVDSYFSTLSALNRYSPLDGAGSHGGLGLQVGAGAGVTQVDHSSILLNEQLHYSQSDSQSGKQTLLSDTAPQSIYQPKLYLLKGLYAPVDIGATYSILDSRRISQLMGHVQVTLFEGFQLPAVALRLNYGKLFGLYSSEFSSTGLDAVVSYGFLRYFTIYADIGVQKNYGALRVSKEQDSAYILQNIADLDESYENLQTSKLAGLHIQIIPAFAVAVLEAQESYVGLKSYLFKLGFGL